jgi:hypothetical protein
MLAVTSRQQGSSKHEALSDFSVAGVNPGLGDQKP